MEEREEREEGVVEEGRRGERREWWRKGKRGERRE